MMNSYHYSCYSYDYDDYPSYCCCSILLNVFLSLDEHDLLHLETSVIFSVPQKDYSSGKKPSVSAFCILFQTSGHCSLSLWTLKCHLGFFDYGFSKRGSAAWTWCSRRLILPLVTPSSVPQLCKDYAHYADLLLISALITSFSDCLLSQQDLVS